MANRKKQGEEARRRVLSGANLKSKAASSPTTREPVQYKPDIEPQKLQQPGGRKAATIKAELPSLSQGITNFQQKAKTFEPATVIQAFPTLPNLNQSINKMKSMSSVGTPTLKLGIVSPQTNPFAAQKIEQNASTNQLLRSAPNVRTYGNIETEQEPFHNLRVDPGLIGATYRKLDQLQKLTEPAAKIAQEFYTPGAGLAPIAGFTGAVGSALSKVAPKLGLGEGLGKAVAREAIKEGVAGAVLGAGQSLAAHPEEGFRGAGTGALYGGLLGGALGPAAPILGKAIKSTGQYVQKIARETTADNLAYQKIVGEIGESSAKAEIGKRNLADLDEQLQSVSTGNAVNKADQFKSLLNERKSVVDFITQHEPEFKAPKPRIQSGAIKSTIAQPIEQFKPSEPPVIGAPSGDDELFSKVFQFVNNGGKATPSALQMEFKVGYGTTRRMIDRLEAGETPPTRAPEPPIVEPNQVRPKVEYIPGEHRTSQFLQRDENLSPETRSAIQAQDNTYERLGNVGTVNRANEAVKDLPLAESKFMANKELGADNTATGYRVIQELDALSRKHRLSNPELANAYTERAVNAANKLADDLTRGGQASQAAAVFRRLSPEGRLLDLVRKADSVGKKPTAAEADTYIDLARESSDSGLVGTRNQEFLSVVQKLKAGEKVTPDEQKIVSEFINDIKSLTSKEKPPATAKPPKEMKDKVIRDRVVQALEAQEKAALERIAKRRGRLSATPLDEWADHAYILALRMAKGAVNFSKWSEDMVREFGNGIKPQLTGIFEKAQRLLEDTVGKVSSKRIYEAERVAEKAIREGNLNPKDAEKLRVLAEQLNGMADKTGRAAEIEMQKILNTYEKSSVFEKISTIRYFQMLFNEVTQSVNILSGPIMMLKNEVADILPLMVDVFMNKAFKKPRNVTMYGRGPFEFIGQWFKDFGIAAKANAQGVSPAGIQVHDRMGGLAFKSLYNPLSWGERSLKVVAGAPDYASYNAVRTSELHKLAHLDAINKKIPKADRKLHITKYLSNPPDEALAQADRMGKDTTFQRMDTLGGKITRLTSNRSGTKLGEIGSQGARFVVPFLKTPLNIASQAVEMTPVGYIKGILQLTGKWHNESTSKREALRTLSNATLGTFGLSSLGYYLNNLGIITSSNESGNINVDKIKEQVGKGKYLFNQSAMNRFAKSFIGGEGYEAAKEAAKYRKGDTQIDYNKLQPLAFPVAFGASMNENKNKGRWGQLGSASSDAFGSLLNMSSVSSVQSIVAPKPGETAGEKSLGIGKRLIESYGKSFRSSLLANQAKREDNTTRSAPYNKSIGTDIKGYFQQGTPESLKKLSPWGSSKGLPASKTTLGQDKRNPVGPYKSQVANYTDQAKFISDLIDRTGDEALAPKPPERKLDGVDIPPARYAKLQEDIGKLVMDYISKIPADYSDTEKSEVLKDIYSEVGSYYRDEIRMERMKGATK